MRLTNSLKVTFVTIFSCLAIMLGLFASTGIASAHSATTLQSQTSASQSAEQWWSPRCRVFTTENVVFVPTHHWWNNSWNDGWNNGWNNSWNNGWNSGLDNGWNSGFLPDQTFQFSENTGNFDFNHGDFSNFNREDENRFGGFFIVKVTETRICHGFHDNRFFQFDEN